MKEPAAPRALPGGLGPLLQRIVAACAVSGIYGAPCGGEPRVWQVPLVAGGAAVTGDAGATASWPLLGKDCSDLCGNPRTDRCRFWVDPNQARETSSLVIRCQSDLESPMAPESSYGGTTCSWRYGTPSATECRVDWDGDGHAVADWTVMRPGGGSWGLAGAACTSLCEGTPVASCQIQLAPDGGKSVTCAEPAPGSGRRPRGLRAPPVRHAPSVGDYFASVAWLEAASVDAFEILAFELGAHRAPARLVRGARRSARDERRHARTMAALARRHGGEPLAPVVERRAPRSLEAIARENAVEGCVRETFGALVATWQAREAGDAHVRAAMERIAEDETRHATLAWGVAEWLDGQLDAAARRRVHAAKRRAVLALRRSAADPPADVQRVAGVPGPRIAAALLDSLGKALWSSAKRRMPS